MERNDLVQLSHSEYTQPFMKRLAQLAEVSTKIECAWAAAGWSGSAITELTDALRGVAIYGTRVYSEKEATA